MGNRVNYEKLRNEKQKEKKEKQNEKFYQNYKKKRISYLEHIFYYNNGVWADNINGHVECFRYEFKTQYN